MANKGALAKDPKVTQKARLTPEQQTRREQTRLNYLQRVRPNDPQVKALQRKLGAAGNGQAKQAPLTPEQVTEQGFQGAGEAYQNVLNRFQNFDPYQMQQQYQPGFTAEMDKARQSVMNQFNQRNAQAFQQERQDFETAMANRGIAPGGEQYNRELQALTDRQDRARQEAMSAAEQQAYGVQQQAFGQAGQLAMMPYEQWGAIQAPYVTGIGAQYSAQENALNRQFQASQAAKDRAAQMQMARMRGAGGGGGAAPDAYSQMLANSLGQGQQQQVNPWAQVAGGFAQGFGAGAEKAIF